MKLLILLNILLSTQIFAMDAKEAKDVADRVRTKKEDTCVKNLTNLFDQDIPVFAKRGESFICGETDCGLSITNRIKTIYEPKGFKVNEEVQSICLYW